MARSRRSRRETNANFANPPSVVDFVNQYRLPGPVPLVDVSDYSDYARQVVNQPPVNLDNRAWTPDPSPNVNRTRSGRQARIKLTDVARRLFSAQTKARLTFDPAKAVMTCVRRKARKEVLHAFKKTGGKGGKQRRPRYTLKSRIKC